MKRFLCAALSGLALCGCSSRENVRVLEANPPWCADYVVTDPVSGKSFLRYNSPQGNFVEPIEGRGDGFGVAGVK